MTFPATRADALARLAAFVPSAGRAYTANRNTDEGPGARTHVSQLSPAIRRRLVTEEEVARAALVAHGFQAAEKFIAEVCWRTYWRGALETRPSLWHRYQESVLSAERSLAADSALARRYARAVSGRTGIDCFDFWATELTTTGYLHNHARMSFASIWIFTLNLPWALGAAHFFRHLLDACPASNTLSWRWVAGLQTAGKTYLASAEIIRRTSMGRFRVEAPLARVAPPLPAEPPAPLVPLSTLPPPDPALKSGLFLHTEDLSPETIPLDVPITALAAPGAIGGDPADLKRAHADTALADGRARAAAHFGMDCAALPEADLESAMLAFAQRHALAQVITPFAPVGPVADRLASIGATLRQAGIRLVPLRRAWDSRAFPAATKGFFAFKSVIPALLA
jgi:deoxyribodipyrimidine photo-lyase